MGVLAGELPRSTVGSNAIRRWRHQGHRSISLTGFHFASDRPVRKASVAKCATERCAMLVFRCGQRKASPCSDALRRNCPYGHRLRREPEARRGQGAGTAGGAELKGRRCAPTFGPAFGAFDGYAAVAVVKDIAHRILAVLIRGW